MIWLIETGPLGFAIAWTLASGGATWQLGMALGGGAGLSLGGALMRSWERGGALVMTCGLGALLAAVGPALVPRPLLGLVLLLISIGLVARIWTSSVFDDVIGLRASRLRADVIDIRVAAAIALATWLVGVAVREQVDPWVAGASALASVLAGARVLSWSRRILRGPVLRLWIVLAGIAALVAAGLAAAGALEAALAVLALVPATTLLLARVGGVEIVDTSWTLLILGHPARLVVATFLVLCAVGFVLLSLPGCAVDPIARLDAAFTAVSAVCVTGLITVDTPRAWTGLGQGAILLLIQLGGLGIMTLSTAALGALGRRLSVRHEEAVAGMFSSEHRGLLFSALRRTLAVTAVVEGAGAVCLAILFWAGGDGFGEGLWRGLFTAISAFCNAGFALQSDSLIPYQSSPAVLHTVALLIIAGGISPAVIVALPRLARRQVVPLQVKIILAASAGLLVFGFLAFLGMEWGNSLADLSIADRLHNAWFQSVTFRTAGFNSVDFAGLTGATLLVSFLLMFVGGAPGGTAGGVKVTTLWVVGATVGSALRGEAEASSFGRRIAHEAVYRAIAIFAIGAAVLAVVLVALLLTQSMAGSLAVFEAFSAIGTVGLSIGGTGELDGLGKVLIMVAMFLGRVGPLTAFLLLVERQRGRGREQLEESVEVG